MGRRLAIIGNGMAATRLVDKLLDLQAIGPDAWQVSVFGAESRPGYNRVLLSEVVDGRVDPTAVTLVDEEQWRTSGIDLRLATTIVRVDPHLKQLETAAGDHIGFDACVFAMGSRPFIPPLRGLRDSAQRLNARLPQGVLTFRTLDDALAIVGWASRAGQVVGHEQPRAVVLGGGLLGLEAAKGLSGRGINTTVIHMADHLMERQLDPTAGGILRRSFERLGVSVLTGAAAQEIQTRAGAACGVVLSDGTSVPADLVVISAGVRPNVELAADAGLPVGHGIQVDDNLRVVDSPDFLAIGECAEHRGQVYGLVAPAWEQAEHAAAVLAGQAGNKLYSGSRIVTRLKAAGIGLASLGEVDLDADADSSQDDPTTEVVTVSDPTRETYKKLVVRDGRLAGAILLGDVGAAPSLAQLFDRQSILPPNRLALLLGRDTERADDPTRIPDRATICQCNGVTKGAIRSAFLNGSRSVTAVAAATKATTGCGGCLDPVTGIVKWLESAEQGSYVDASSSGSGPDPAHQNTDRPSQIQDQPDQGRGEPHPSPGCAADGEDPAPTSKRRSTPQEPDNVTDREEALCAN